MAKSHKTCMEQAEIIDTFGMYQLLTTIQKQCIEKFKYHYNYELFRSLTNMALTSNTPFVP